MARSSLEKAQVSVPPPLRGAPGGVCLLKLYEKVIGWEEEEDFLGTKYLQEMKDILKRAGSSPLWRSVV